MQLSFGAGDFFAQMIADENGTSTPTATPVRVAGMQGFTLDFQGEVKEYYGQNRYALAAAMGKVKANGKINGALINGNALNTLFFNSTLSSGTQKAAFADTAGSIIPATPFQITVTPPSSGTFVDDLGVIDGATGIPLTKVASAPATGQYSVSALGVYTFAAADTLKTVYISYSYTFANTTARSMVIQNKQMGLMPTIKGFFTTQFRGKKAYVELESVVSNKLALFATKNDDFPVQEVDFVCQCDSAGFKLGTIWVQE